jgi:sugar phosphate isomerase/epimerase
MYLTGFADEAAPDLDGQIRATQELGWRNIEARAIGGTNLTDITDEQFEKVCEKLDAAGIMINCFGSGVANWAKKISDPPESSYEELKRAIPRMHKLETKLIRVMSFAVPEDASINEPEMADEVIRRMRELTRMAEDGGVTLVHENCNNWGGRSYEHTLRLLDAIQSPHLRLVFDTGNPVFRKDIRGEPPYRYQDAWEFYRNVKDFVVYVHIKDGKVFDDKMRFTFAGEGDGHVKQILQDLHKSGYDGGISIEPHLAVVYHDSTQQTDASIRYENYVEYGRRMEKLVHETGWRDFK